MIVPYIPLFQLLLLSTLLSSIAYADTNNTKPIFRDDIPPVEIAHEMVLLSKYVYEIEARESHFVPETYNSIFWDNTEEGSQVVIVTPKNKTKDYLVVAIRGTEEVEDVLTDLEAVHTELGPEGGGLPVKKYGEVHQGFNEAAFRHRFYKNIENVVKMALKKHPKKKVYFTGHSLGGALSTIMGAYMATRMKKRDITVINFGSPRPGDEMFHNWVSTVPNLAVWRFVNNNDVVPRTPVGIINDWWHAGHLIQLEDRDDAKLYYQQVGNESMGYAGVPWYWNIKSSGLDHIKDSYVSFISVKSMAYPEKYYVSKFETIGDEALVTE